MYELLIQNGGTVYLPAVEDGVVWDTERKGSPGRLSFSVVKEIGRASCRERVFCTV